MQVSGKVFVVTGAGNGIGREVTRQLLARGARVVALDLRGESLEEMAQLAGAPAEALSLHAVDVSDAAAVDAVMAEAMARFGAIDGLLNVAGIIQPFVKLVDLDVAAMHKVMDVNFWGVVHTTKALLPQLLARPEACIVNVSSMGGFTPVPGQAVYGASKAAVKLLTEALYAECRGSNVAVTVVYPGGVGTDIATNSGVMVAGGGHQPAQEAGAFPTTSAAEAGRIIVEAVEKGPYRVLIGKDAAMLDRLSRLSPRRATELIAKKMAALLG